MYLGVIIFFITFIFIVLKFKSQIEPIDSFEPLVLFSVTISFYSLSLPISRIIFNTEKVPGVDENFLVMSMTALIGFCLGYLIMSLLKRQKKIYRKQNNNLPKFVKRINIFLIGCSIIFYYIFTETYYGGISDYLTGGHNLAPSNFDLSYGLLAFWGPVCLSVALVLGYASLSKEKVIMKIFYGSLLIIYIVATLSIGNRNELLWTLLPLLTIYHYKKKEVKTSKIILIYITMIFVANIIGIAREWFRNLSWNSRYIYVNDLDLLLGEFGTSYNVFKTYLTHYSSYFDSLGLGLSYLNSFFSLIPKSIWPSRPIEPSIVFIHEYHSYAVGHLGFGFSPIVEAIWNFGIYGPFFVFLFLGVILRIIYVYVINSKNAINLICLAFLPPFYFNFMRIDFATSLKLLLMRIFVIYVIVIIYKILVFLSFKTKYQIKLDKVFS